MTGKQLKELAIKRYGEKHWCSTLAAVLKLERSTVWRYSKLDEVPYLVAEKAKALVKADGRK